MSKLGPWDANFSVGHPLLDEQHRKLHALFQMAAEPPPVDAADSREQYHLILNDLVSLVRHHFETEEALLIASDYPDLEPHKAEHQHFEAQLTDLLCAATSGQVDWHALTDSLCRWWWQHVTRSDTAYRPFMEMPVEDSSLPTWQNHLNIKTGTA